VRQLARVIFRVASRGMNDKLKVLGFVPVMLDMRIGLHREVCEDLGRQFGHARLLPGVRNDIRVAEAFGHGKPVRQHAARSRAAQDYAGVADAVERMWGVA
jgi:chromosome partitioning protein